MNTLTYSTIENIWDNTNCFEQAGFSKSGYMEYSDRASFVYGREDLCLESKLKAVLEEEPELLLVRFPSNDDSVNISARREMLDFLLDLLWESNENESFIKYVIADFPCSFKQDDDEVDASGDSFREWLSEELSIRGFCAEWSVVLSGDNDSPKPHFLLVAYGQGAPFSRMMRYANSLPLACFLEFGLHWFLWKASGKLNMTLDSIFDHDNEFLPPGMKVEEPISKAHYARQTSYLNAFGFSEGEWSGILYHGDEHYFCKAFNLYESDAHLWKSIGEAFCSMLSELGLGRMWKLTPERSEVLIS